jgi:hypothetical protein
VILGIPTLNRYDLLEGLIASAERGTVRPTEYLIIDNGGTYTPSDSAYVSKIFVQRSGRNIGVAASWNRILRRAHSRGEPVVISNDDIVLGEHVFEEMVGLLHAGGFGLINGYGWALFGQTPRCTEIVGYYDENFYPAYYEDCDYDRRLKLAGVRRRDTENKSEHVGWATSRALGLGSEHDAWLRQNLDYFYKKWGGVPGSEIFTEPFNGSPPSGWKCVATEENESVGRPPVMRWDVLNRIAKHIGAERYLEIGCANGECVAKISVPIRWGVDPAPQWASVKHTSVFVSMKSSDFFDLGIYPQPGFDLIFIDSDHRAAVAYEEVRRSLGILAPGGVIVLHDANPSEEAMQIVPMVQSLWTGDVWKAVAAIGLMHGGVKTVDTDYGCAVLRFSANAYLPKEPPTGFFNLTWQDLVARRSELLGLVSVEEFERGFP